MRITMPTLLCLAVATAWGGDAAWPAAVPGFQPPKAGEHPRMLFRASDVAALKAKAKTPDGERILAQLKVVLGGGDAMPTNYCQEKPVNSVDERAVGKQPIGTFTLSHAAGFGLLYQITGDAKYAELAKESLEKIFAGQVDRDSRYNLPTPGTGFRLGFVYQSIALAYDLCYQAWPEDYRKSVVERVLTAKPKKVDKGGKEYSLEELAKGGGYPPGSNHFGAYLLGPAMVAMAFHGDPGADDARLDKLLSSSEAGLQKQLGHGFGDHGWFAEGTSCGRISANNGLLPLMESLKIAAGKDYISPRPDGRYTVLHLMHEIVPSGGRAMIPHRGDYGDDVLYSRPIISHMGDFAEGMGAVLPKEAEAMGWIYRHSVESGGDPKIYDATYYPHLAVYAFVNWPAKDTDPDEVLPHVMVDDIHGYYVARNRWQDGDDVLVTSLLKRGPGGYKSGKVHAGTVVWGLGAKFDFGGLGGKTALFKESADGSMVLADEKGNALVVDFSGASGATAVIAAIGAKDAPSSAVAKSTTVSAGGASVTVVTLNKGEHPAVTADGAKITIGKQVITVADGKLDLGTFIAKH